MKKLNAAVIGCGSISPNHLETLLNCQDANLIAVCDIDEQKVRKASQKYNCKAYTDYKEMLKYEDIDVVHICTPHYLHAPIAIEAMKAGKNVLTEKPMAISISDAKEMINVSKETDMKLGVCFQNRYNTTSIRIKELIESGRVGSVIGGKASVTWHRDEVYYASAEWRGTWDKEGGGVLINQAIHTLDLLQWLIGDIDKVKGTIDTRLLNKFIEVEDTAEATILFKNKATVLFYATNCYAVNSPVEIELICEKAIINLRDDLTVTYKNGEIEKVNDKVKATGEKAYWGIGHSLLINDFYKKLLNGEEISVNCEEGIKAIQMFNAIYTSNKTKEYVAFEALRVFE